jgi:fructokinase
MTALFGGIEAGGTKFNCIVASGPDEILAETRFPTTTPHETIAQVIEFFRQHGALAAVGIACFGPLDLNPASSAFGSITSTPKPGWANTDIRGWVQRELEVPVGIDTDVNAAAIAEGTWGACQGLENFVYFTIGTGVGGGAVVNARPLHGLVHPEMGHIGLPHDRVLDPFPGACPFHNDCFEGLAAGPAINKRWGQPAETLPPHHPAWDLEAGYIAQAMKSVVCTLSPQRIVLGGGVMQQPHIFPLVRQKTVALLNGYVQSPAILEHIEDYIVAPGLGTHSGMLGALALAQQQVSR